MNPRVRVCKTQPPPAGGPSFAASAAVTPVGVEPTISRSGIGCLRPLGHGAAICRKCAGIGTHRRLTITPGALATTAARSRRGRPARRAWRWSPRATSASPPAPPTRPPDPSAPGGGARRPRRRSRSAGRTQTVGELGGGQRRHAQKNILISMLAQRRERRAMPLLSHRGARSGGDGSSSPPEGGLGRTPPSTTPMRLSSADEARKTRCQPPLPPTSGLRGVRGQGHTDGGAGAR